MRSLALLVFIIAQVLAVRDKCDDSDLLLGNRCYFFNNIRQSYTSAKKFCEDSGRTLAVFDNIAQINFVTSTASTKFSATYGNFWIGHYRNPEDHIFYWLDGTSVVFKNWLSGFPFESQNHVAQQLSNGKWVTTEESTLLPSVCSTFAGPIEEEVRTTVKVEQVSSCKEDDLFLGQRCYSFHPSRVNHNNAKATCESIGKTLAVFDNTVQINFVTATASTKFGATYGTFWIGLYRNQNNLRWIDQTAVSFANWNPGFPFGEQTVVSQQLSNGKWKTSEVSEMLPTVCSGTL